jgi:GntR family transcriptional regulator/MocR family aminotransferase
MLTYVFQPESGKPLYEQLYSFIRKDIEIGKLKSGEQLPSKRKLSAHLKVSVITVEGAYGQLLAEGYIRSKARCGFFVQPLLVGERKKNSPKSEQFPVPQRKGYHAHPEREYDFATNAVDTDYFPFSSWAKLMRQVLWEDKLLEATEPQGLYELRQTIVRHLYEFRGMSAEPEQIVVGAGSEYLTGLLVQLLGREKGYGVENPGYHKIRSIFQKNGAEVFHISMDELGLNVENLRQSGANVAHVMPSHHFPLGIVMPAARRMELLHWASEVSGRYIIEDDYDSEFRFSGRPIPALQRLDQNEKVIYMNTFAKSLAPSLRIGYMVLPPHLTRRYQDEFMFYASTVPIFEQMTLARFMERGHFERHIGRMRNVYKTRRDALISAAAGSSLGECFQFSGEDAGLHLLLSVKNGMTEQELVSRASKDNIGVYGLSGYYAVPDENMPKSTLVLGYARLRAKAMGPAFERLANIWRN